MQGRFSKLTDGPTKNLFVWSFGTRIVLLALGFLTSLALARLFGPAPVAQMSLVVSLLVVTSHLSLFGSQMTILKRLPEQDDLTSTAEVLGSAGMVTLLLGLLVGCAISGLILMGWLGTYADQLDSSFIVALPLIVLVSAFRVMGIDTLRGLLLISWYNSLAVINALLLLFLVVAIWMLGHEQINMPWVLLAIEVITLSLTLLLLFTSRPELRIRLQTNRRAIHSHLRISSIYFLSSSSILVGQIDLLVAGGIVPLEQLGFYAIGTRLASLAGLALMSINIPFAPRVSSEFRSRGLSAALALAQAQTRILVPATFAIGTGIAILGYPILMLFGSSFVSAYPALLILLIGHLGTSIFGPIGVFLNMTSGHRAMVLVTFIELSVALIGSLLLIPNYGIMGAAIANATAQITRGLSATAILYLRANTTISIFHSLKSGK